MLEPGRNFSLTDDTNFRYGFNNKEDDNDVEGKGNLQDYGTRIYLPRLGRFITVDLLSKKFPQLSVYEFASGSPISGIDLDGLEYYYAPDGTLLGHLGNNLIVFVVDDKYIKQAVKEIHEINSKKTPEKKAQADYENLMSRSALTGLTNDELNTRAFLSLLQKHEVGTGPDRYKKRHGGGLMNDFKDHPGFNKGGGSAAGAYQIILDTWTKVKTQAGLKDFSPQSQDGAAVQIIKDNKAFDDVSKGNLVSAEKKLKGQWSSLPGGSQSHVSKSEANKEFKQFISNELSGQSLVATPQEKLLK